MPDERRPRPEAPAAQRAPVAGEPFPGGHRLAGAGDARDPAVSHVNQVLGRLLGGPLIVHQDGVGRGAAQPPVQRHHWDAQVEQRGHVGVPGGRRRDDHAGHPHGGRGRDVAGLLARVFVAVTQHDGVAATLRGVLHPADHRGEERVANVRDDHRPQRRLPAAKAAGDAVRLVAEGLDRGLHAAHQIRVHRAAAVQHAGHRRGRHLRAPRHVLDSRHRLRPTDAGRSSSPAALRPSVGGDQDLTGAAPAGPGPPKTSMPVIDFRLL